MLLGNGFLPMFSAAGHSEFILDFTAGTMPVGASLTRSSSASRIKSDGQLEIVGNNVARFDYDPSTLLLKGLLIEPTKTNMFANSNAFNLWAVIGTLTRTPDFAVGPDGATTADRVQYSPGSPAYLYQGTAGFTSGQIYTVSLWLKSNTGSTQTISVFLPATGTIIGTVQATTTWQRRSLTVAANANNGFAGLVFNGSTFDVLVSACQCEAGQLSSYYPTTTAAARAADSLSFTVPVWCNSLRFTFDDLSTQDVAVTPGTYTVPTNLNRAWIRKIEGGT